jgi:hypothetical protein
MLLGLEHGGCRAITCCQPCPASLTSQRRRAAPPALGVGDAACPNNKEDSLPYSWLTELLLSTRNNLNSYDLHALRERAAVLRRYRQPASRPRGPLLPLAQINIY